MNITLRDTPTQLDTTPAPALHGRAPECAHLEHLLRDVTAGSPATLRVLGEPGIGKSSMLEFVARNAPGFRILRARGVAGERELPYSGLHLLCAPLLRDSDRLERAQRDALASAIGLIGGQPPDRFLVSLAALNLLTDIARRNPVCCLVDDAHRLDRASLLVLAFIARHVEPCHLLLVFGELDRQDVPELDGLPEMRLEGLPQNEAQAVLSTEAPGWIDPAVTERMLLEARGNPSRLHTALDGVAAADLAGGYAIPAPRTDRRKRDHDCEQRAQRLPADSRLLLLTAAAEPTGDPTLVWRAGVRLGIGPQAADALKAERLVVFGPRVIFGCNRLRASVYASAAPADVRLVHQALAEEIEGDANADRWAWHRALATTGPDDRIADDLEQNAAAAQSRGGTAARAAFLERAALLTANPAMRAWRALRAADAHQAAGRPDSAEHLLTIAESGPPDPALQAQVGLQRARVTFATRRDQGTPRLLLDAALRIRTQSPGLAQHAHLEALAAALLSCRAAPTLRDAALAARDTAADGTIGPISLLLDALATRVLDGAGAAAGPLRHALASFGGPLDAAAREWSWLAGLAAADAWDDEAWAAFAAHDGLGPTSGDGRQGEPSAMGQASIVSALLDLYRGRFHGAEVIVARGNARTAGSDMAPPTSAALLVAAWQGRQDILQATATRARRDAQQCGDSLTLTATQLAEAILHNGSGQYEQAMASAIDAAQSDQIALSGWARVELIEAAVRCGQRDLAGAALDRLSRDADAAATRWALGVRATAQALLAGKSAPENLYREAIHLLSQTDIRTHLARAQLLYGEWLRRQNRRIDARASLRAAQRTFLEIGAAGFAARTSAELLATGERARKRNVETCRQLTPQESRIGYLARDGLSNSQIGARLFVSPRTVEYHLHKVFAKLGISSRTELHLVLNPGGGEALADAQPQRVTTGAMVGASAR